MSKRTLALAARIAICIAIVSFGMFTFTPSFAEEPPVVASDQTLKIQGGDGRKETPYRITTCAQLEELSSNYQKRIDNFPYWTQASDSSMILINDIDCSDSINWNGGKGFTPFNDLQNGYFDGRNHSIKNLYINDIDNSGSRPQGKYATAFIRNASNNYYVKNVKFVGGSITRSYAFSPNGADPSFDSTGSIIGSASGAAIINVQSSINITSNAPNVGGLVGYIESGSDYDNINEVSKSSFTGNITGTLETNATYNAPIGGLIGFGSYATLSNSYANTNITATSKYKSAGGLAGLLYLKNGDESKTKNNYSAGIMNYAGGSVYASSYGIDWYVNDSFSTMVGTIEDNTNTGNYYNTTTEPPLNNWDFNNVWKKTSTLPELRDDIAITPDAPQTLITQKSSEGSSYNLSWQAPQNDGGSLVVGYKYKYIKFLNEANPASQNNPAPDTHQWFEYSPEFDVKTNTTSIKVDGLDPNSQYIFQVAAINGVGTGQYSYTRPVQKVKPRLFYKAPDMPRKITLNALSSTKYDISNINQADLAMIGRGSDEVESVAVTDKVQRTYYLLISDPDLQFQALPMNIELDHLDLSLDFPNHIINNISVLSNPKQLSEYQNLGERELKSYTTGSINENNKFDGLKNNIVPLVLKIDTTATTNTATISCIETTSSSLWGEQRIINPNANKACIGIAPESGYTLDSNFTKDTPIKSGDSFTLPISVNDTINYESRFGTSDRDYFSKFYLPSINAYGFYILLPDEMTFESLSDSRYSCSQNWVHLEQAKEKVISNKYSHLTPYFCRQNVLINGYPENDRFDLTLNLKANQDLVSGSSTAYIFSFSDLDARAILNTLLSTINETPIDNINNRLFEISTYKLEEIPESTTTTTQPETTTTTEPESTTTVPESTTTTTEPESTTTVPESTTTTTEPESTTTTTQPETTTTTEPVSTTTVPDVTVLDTVVSLPDTTFAPPQVTGTLSYTGSDSSALALVAGIAIAVGSVLYFAARKQKKTL